MTVEIFDKIIANHEEYWKCINHIHIRGADDVREETIPLVEEAAKMGYSGKDFKAYVLSINPELNIRKDVFARAIIKYLNENKTEKK